MNHYHMFYFRLASISQLKTKFIILFLTGIIILISSANTLGNDLTIYSVIDKYNEPYIIKKIYNVAFTFNPNSNHAIGVLQDCFENENNTLSVTTASGHQMLFTIIGRTTEFIDNTHLILITALIFPSLIALWKGQRENLL